MKAASKSRTFCKENANDDLGKDNHMQFGMPTLIELKSPEETAALCNELGLEFIELNIDLPQYQADRLDITELRRIADKYDSITMQ